MGVIWCADDSIRGTFPRNISGINRIEAPEVECWQLSGSDYMPSRVLTWSISKQARWQRRRGRTLPPQRGFSRMGGNRDSNGGWVQLPQ
jgi:hypothetical protein